MLRGFNSAIKIMGFLASSSPVQFSVLHEQMVIFAFPLLKVAGGATTATPCHPVFFIFEVPSTI